MGYRIGGFRYPAADTIGGRTSTICRSMACTLAVRESCTQKDEDQWRQFFGDTCAYCGEKATHLDHLYPLVENREPTGYGTGPSNLVPCCGKCNQAKGNRLWDEFMKSGDCKHKDGKCDERMKKIIEFQRIMRAKPITIGDEAKKQWREIRDAFDKALKDAEDRLVELKKQLVPASNEASRSTSSAVPVENPAAKKAAEGIGKHVQRIFQLVLPRLDKKKLELLCDTGWCNRQLGLNFAMLSRTREKTNGQYRYYRDGFLLFGETYYLTSQWYDRHREPFDDWMKNNFPDVPLI